MSHDIKYRHGSGSFYWNKLFSGEINSNVGFEILIPLPKSDLILECLKILIIVSNNYKSLERWCVLFSKRWSNVKIEPNGVNLRKKNID